MTMTPSTLQMIQERLGREPRGLDAVSVWKNDEPAVIRVSALVDDKPFPTLFWLIDPAINYALDRLEARGVIALLQSEIDQSEQLQQALNEDHLAYIALRNHHMPESIRDELMAKGFYDVLQRRGIGGIENFQRIRCLHTYYAAHLVRSNTVGTMIEQFCANSSDHYLNDAISGTIVVQE